MALRPSRLVKASPAPAREATPEPPATVPVLPAVKPARARDAEALERLRKLAAEHARTKPPAGDLGKRRTRRKATTLPGLITFKTMRLQVPCTISDMSGTGARLLLPAATAAAYGDLDHLPDELTLVLRADRMQVDCEVKWRRPTSLGIRFLGPPVPIPMPGR